MTIGTFLMNMTFLQISEITSHKNSNFDKREMKDFSYYWERLGFATWKVRESHRVIVLRRI